MHFTDAVERSRGGCYVTRPGGSGAGRPAGNLIAEYIKKCTYDYARSWLPGISAESRFRFCSIADFSASIASNAFPDPLPYDSASGRHPWAELWRSWNVNHFLVASHATVEASSASRISCEQRRRFPLHWLARCRYSRQEDSKYRSLTYSAIKYIASATKTSASHPFPNEKRFRSTSGNTAALANRSSLSAVRK